MYIKCSQFLFVFKFIKILLMESFPKLNHLCDTKYNIENVNLIGL